MQRHLQRLADARIKTIVINLGWLGERIAEHKVDCWLVNTGWTGGPYGVGNRMEIAHTRSMINAILNGNLKKVQLKTDPIFGLQVPES